MESRIDNRGFSLVEVVIAMGVLSVALLTIATVNSQLKQVTTKTTNQTGVEQFRESIISAVRDTNAWQETYKANSGGSGGGGGTSSNPWCILFAAYGIKYPGCPTGAGSQGGTQAGSYSNGNMDCLRYGTQCTGIANQNFALMDGAGNLIYNALNPTEGFTPAGKRCTTYDPNNATGECYYHYDLRWTPMCAGGAGCVNPMVSVDAVLSVSKNAKTQVGHYAIPGVYRTAQ